MSNFLSEFPLPSMSRHSSSSALTRRSSASTVISASRYEINTPPHRDFGIREVPDDVEVVAVGEYLKEISQNVNYLFMCFKAGVSDALLLESLSTDVFEPRTSTGSRNLSFSTSITTFSLKLLSCKY